MGQLTKIEWADHTFNPWIGCTKVSPACDNCYAEAFAKRTGGPAWGKGQPRRLTSDANWRKPLAWNRKAAKEGRRYRVFCASLADVFDAEVPDEWRINLFRLIVSTPNLDWLILTKRPKVARGFLSGFAVAEDGFLTHNGDTPTVNGGTGEIIHGVALDQKWPLPNVWLGTTVENQDMADARIPLLLDTPAAVRFLSCEPLLGPVDLTAIRHGTDEELPVLPDWVIASGESGPRARPSHPNWFRSLRDQCAAADVPFFFKQWGEWTPMGPIRNSCKRVIAHDGRTCAFEEDAMKALERDERPTALQLMYRLGKARAGRTLDGRIHDAVPEALPCAV